MKQKTSFLKKCKFLLGSHQKMVIYCIIFGILSVIFDVGSILFSCFYGINTALISKDIKLITLTTIIIAVLGLLSMIFFHISYRLGLKLTKNISDELRKRAFEKAVYFDVNYFTTHSTGAMINTIVYDVSIFSDGMSFTLQVVVRNLVKIILSLLVITIINIKLSLILWILLPIVSIFAFFIYRKLGKLYEIRRNIKKKRLSHINEGIVGFNSVKSLNLEEKEEKIFKQYNREHFKVGMRLCYLNELLWRFFDVFTYVALAILFIKSYEFNLSYGELFLYYQIFKTILYVVARLASDFDSFVETLVSGDKVYNLLVYEQLVKDREVTETLDKNSPKTIIFENVTFTYPNGETVLKDFNLKIEENKKFAIVGKTGGGKSTIANLVYRFYEPTSGMIKIGDNDYTKYRIQNLHREIGFILQDPMLFDDTILNNLKYAKENASDEEIQDAIKFVGADEFIFKLKDGINTKIGESGIMLSNGQKQLLALARIVLKNPSIIIFDEATANIDSGTEMIIQKNISKLFKGKTCIYIAHRLSTIKDADVIVYLENGKIVEMGSHSELMQKNGKYAALYNNQFLKEQISEII